MGLSGKEDGGVLGVATVSRKDEIMVVLALPAGVISMWPTDHQEVNPTADSVASGTCTLKGRLPPMERVQHAQALAANEVLQRRPIPLTMPRLRGGRRQGGSHIWVHGHEVSVEVPSKQHHLSG